jgi:hypothetical protein
MNTLMLLKKILRRLPFFQRCQAGVDAATLRILFLEERGQEMLSDVRHY